MLYESFLAFAIVFFAGLAFYGAASGRLAGGMRHAFQIYLFLVLGVYFVACWSRLGSTLPMQTWSMRVVNADGSPVNVNRATLRYVLAWPSLLLFGGGLIWALFDRNGQFLHDRLAGTKIVAGGS
jgi:uncharacterized RDD family membrane protein YckC